MSAPKLLDPDVAAQRINKSVRTLANWRSEQIGPPFIKIGRDPYYPEDELDDWIARLPRQGDTARRARR